MHRYEELEKLYYKKLFIKYFFFFVIILVIFGVILFLFHMNNKKANKVQIIQKSKTETNATITTKKIVKKINSVTFILPVIKEEVSKKEVVSSHKIQQSSKVVKEKVNSKINNSNKILIKEKEVSITQLIDSFKRDPNLDLAIVIANKYLQENNLSAAQEWALKANNMNPQDERSWLIFADILVKKKKIQKAREVLNFYIDSYGKNDKIENKLRSLNDK